MSLYGPEQRRKNRVYTRQPIPDERPQYLACSVCRFPVPYDNVPGGGFPTVLEVTGTQYVWDSPDDALSTCDLQITPVTQPTISCPFCGSTRWMDGSRGTQ